MAFAQRDACVEAGGCTHKPNASGWERGDRPVINVSWNDITKEYIPWLNQYTGKKLSLPSEPVWEYAVRAGSISLFYWGGKTAKNMANCLGCVDENIGKTVPVGSFSPNKFGLYDMHGNVYEWVQDCLNWSYKDSPLDGGPWVSGDCNYRALRGGAWDSFLIALQSYMSNFSDICSGQ